MKSGAKRDLAASVKFRLLTMARERSEELQYVLMRYAIERLLCRISQSPHAERFILKGAILSSGWEGGAYRATKDLDLLGCGENSPDALAQVFREVARADVEPDGLVFDPKTIVSEPIREEASYPGVRIHIIAHMGKARIPLQVDIGFGDPVTPGPVDLEIPGMLNFKGPSMRAYPIESVVAEKFETLVRLGMKTGRIKDFYDLWYVATHFPFQGSVLQRAIRNTFRARGTPIPSDPPIALADEFEADPSKQGLWKAFTGRSGIDDPGDLHQLLELLRSFLLPVVLSRQAEFAGAWHPSGPWQVRVET